MDTAPHIDVRETRGFTGEYVLTEQDMLTGCQFPDSIGLGRHPVDTHNPDGMWVRFMPAQAPCYGIPYRCLVPLGVENLLVAGRIICAAQEAMASARVMFTCMASGHAAGVAGALTSTAGIEPRRLHAPAVQRELVAQGGIISDAQARELDAVTTLAASDANVAELDFLQGRRDRADWDPAPGLERAVVATRTGSGR